MRAPSRRPNSAEVTLKGSALRRIDAARAGVYDADPTAPADEPVLGGFEDIQGILRIYARSVDVLHSEQGRAAVPLGNAADLGGPRNEIGWVVLFIVRKEDEGRAASLSCSSRAKPKMWPEKTTLARAGSSGQIRAAGATPLSSIRLKSLQVIDNSVR